MTTITLNENLNQHLNAIAQQTHASVDEVVEGICANEEVAAFFQHIRSVDTLKLAVRYSFQEVQPLWGEINA